MADTSSEIEKCFRVCRIRSTHVIPPSTSTTEGDSSVADNTQPDPQQPILNLRVGQWVVVKYEEEEFPGEVTRIENSDVEVNVMQRSANAWKWPRSEDKIFYSTSNIVRVISPPSVAGNRGQFVFKDII